MAQRLDLHAIFRAVLGEDHVYFQPPANVSLQYPCIVYERARMSVDYADNSPYRHAKRYKVTLITSNPDSELLDKIAMLPQSSHDAFYTEDSLNHDVFTIYF